MGRKPPNLRGILVAFGGGKKVTELEERVAELEAENARFKKALEFYGNVNNWNQGHKYRDSDNATIFQEEDSSVAVDKGSVALKALSGE